MPVQRLLIVGDDFRMPHGVVNYTRPLAGRLREAGHTVHYFYSGSTFLAYDALLLPRVRRFREQGIRFHKIVNSPIYAQRPGSPEADLSSPAIERMFRSLLRRARPDVVYVDSLLGLPSSLLEAAAGRNVPVVLAHHVYRLFCQQGVFHDREGAFCGGPVDLDRCAACYQEVNAATYIRTAQLRSLPLLPALLDRAAFPLWRRLRALAARRAPGAGPLPAGGADGAAARADARREALRGRLGERLRRNVEILNRCVDVHICVSRDVAEHLVRFGVRADRVRVQHIGSLVAERFRPKQHPLDPSAVVIGNIGGINPYKGSHVLVRALRLLAGRPDWRAEIHGKTIDAYQRELRAIFDDPRVAYTGAYPFEAIDRLVDGIDVMVLPSVCNDTAAQTIFESFAGRVPIVASRIGGFPDFVRDGENGLLFEPGNAEELAGKLAGLLDRPERIRQMSDRIARPKTLAENVRELEELFRELSLQRPGGQG